MRLMENLSNVDRLLVKSATADTISYRVTLRGGAERLDRMLRLSGMLEPAERSRSAIDMPDYGRDDRDDELSTNNDAQFGVTSATLQYVFRTD